LEGLLDLEWIDGMGIKAARAPCEHVGMRFVLGIGERREELLVARWSAHILGRAPAFGLDENRIGEAWMGGCDALDLDRVLPAIGIPPLRAALFD
jgi:hypothetical protein